MAEPGPSALPLLTINPGYYDPALPPQALQVLAVDLLGMEIDMPAGNPRQRRTHACHLLEAADWPAVAAGLGREPRAPAWPHACNAPRYLLLRQQGARIGRP